MTKIKPITKGGGMECYTLYIPFSVLRTASSFDTDHFIKVLAEKLPSDVQISSIEGKGIPIISISTFTTKKQAKACFDYIKNIFLCLAIESDIAIYISDTVEEIDSKMQPTYFPAGWPDGENAGWSPDSDIDLIRVDGFADITSPVIVPQHKRIVEAGVICGHLQRKIKPENIKSAIDKAPKKSIDKKTEMAAKAYINAFSHDNIELRFLNLVTCLEILADIRDRCDEFKNAVSMSSKIIQEIAKITDNNEIKNSLEKISSLIHEYKKQSIKESIQELIDKQLDIIIPLLPPDFPHRNNQKLVSLIYEIRSKIVHTGTIGKISREDFYRANQFLLFATKALLKQGFDAA